MSVDSDVAAVRAALLPAIARDARRTRRGWRLGALVLVALGLGSTGVAAATGPIWADPNRHQRPGRPEWQYYSGNPYERDGGCPVLYARAPRRAGPGWSAKRRTGLSRPRAWPRAAAATPGHPLACFAPDGDLLPITETTRHARPGRL